jgi:nucleotide-binding universal stress UspA family protein
MDSTVHSVGRTRRVAVQDRPILICYDGSPSANRAIVAAALLLGRRMAVVLDVVPPLVDVGRARPSSEQPFVDGIALSDARARATAGAELAERAGFEAEARPYTAVDIWKGVNDVADEIDAAAIVVGSRRLNGIPRLVEGSVSREIMRHARRPVLLFPSDVKEFVGAL